jgi:hypothetical protein
VRAIRGLVSPKPTQMRLPENEDESERYAASRKLTQGGGQYDTACELVAGDSFLVMSQTDSREASAFGNQWRSKESWQFFGAGVLQNAIAAMGMAP